MIVPIELFLGFIGMSIVLAIFGFLRNPQIPATIVFGGMFIIAITVNTTQISFGEIPSETETILAKNVTSHMNQQTSSGSNVLRNGNNIMFGEKVANINSKLYNKEMNELHVRISRTGSPTGQVYAGVWDCLNAPTSTNYIYLIAQHDSATFLTGVNDVVFSRNDTRIHVLKYCQVVGLFFNGGSAGNEINIFSNATASTFDTTNSIQSRYNAGWIDGTTADLRGMIVLVQDKSIEEVIETQPNLFEFTNFIKVIFALIGSIFMLAGALMVIKD